MNKFLFEQNNPEPKVKAFIPIHEPLRLLK